MGTTMPSGRKIFCVFWAYLLGSTLPLHLWRREKHFQDCKQKEEQWKREFKEEYQDRLEKKCREEVQRAFGLSS